jgi:phage/plasmid-like protein (TIGR03299 family)
MAHLVSSMAYVGDTPWHGLGHALPPNQPIDVWAQKAGMDWRILDTPVRYLSEAQGHLGTVHTYPDQRVLYRSDTKEPLSVVSQRYQIVQPREVLEFYRDLSDVSGFELETAGVLKGGRKFWALARTGQTNAIKGTDTVHGYLLLATSCDGTLATTATPTTIRVVCNNTLAIALNGAPQAIKVPHRTAFNPLAVKQDLGIAISQWDGFMYRMKTLAERKVKSHESMNFFLNVFAGTDTAATKATSTALTNERSIKKAMALYEGQGKGAELSSAKGTAWGLLNSVTELVDHERRAKSEDHRQDSAWFGNGAVVKQRALELALDLVS